MNIKELARKVAKIEGKKRQVNIAQISEILRIVLKELAKTNQQDLLTTLKRYK